MKKSEATTHAKGEAYPFPFDLNAAREQINQTDEEIVALLEKRFNIVVEIGKYKKENSFPILDEEREKKVLNSCIGYLKNKDYSKAIEEIYIQIMNSSKGLEK